MMADEADDENVLRNAVERIAYSIAGHIARSEPFEIRCPQRLLAVFMETARDRCEKVGSAFKSSPVGDPDADPVVIRFVPIKE